MKDLTVLLRSFSGSGIQLGQRIYGAVEEGEGAGWEGGRGRGKGGGCEGGRGRGNGAGVTRGSGREGGSWARDIGQCVAKGTSGCGLIARTI